MKLGAIAGDPRVDATVPSAGPGAADEAATQILPAIPVPPTTRLNALDDWDDIADAVEKAMTPPAGSPVVDEDSDD